MKKKTAPASSRGKRATADAELLAQLEAAGDPARAAHALRYFRTGPGEYGEGDRFLGLTTPIMKDLVKQFRGRVDLGGCRRLLASPWHEARTAAVILLLHEAELAAKAGDIPRLTAIETFYDAHLDRVNNWDLVDISAPGLMAAVWGGRGDKPAVIRKRLDAWADSGYLWRERAAMVATLALIRRGELGETFRLAARFRDHSHDLIHKAIGWMLREAGRRDREALRAFLAKWTPELPRTALRYAIERMTPEERGHWLAVPSGRRRSR